MWVIVVTTGWNSCLLSYVCMGNWVNMYSRFPTNLLQKQELTMSGLEMWVIFFISYYILDTVDKGNVPVQLMV